MEKTPIILVPGIACTPALYIWKKKLEKEGYPVVIARFYWFIAGSTIEDYACRLKEEVELTLRKYGAEKCHLMGFSLGALVSAYYVLCAGGHRYVGKCVCVTGPFGGVRKIWKLALPLTPLLRCLPDLFWESKPLREMRFARRVTETQIFSIRSNHDIFCPLRSASLGNAVNFKPVGAGHIGIYFCLSPKAFRQVIECLK